MKRILFAMVLIAGLFVTGGLLYGHHSFAATYKEGESQKIEGTVVQLLFRNPHSFLHVDAPDDKGVMQTWAIEWGAGGQLGRQGVTRDSLKPGDHIIVTGQPGRNPEDHRMRLSSIVRPADGWKWGGGAGQTFD